MRYLKNWFVSKCVYLTLVIVVESIYICFMNIGNRSCPAYPFHGSLFPQIIDCMLVLLDPFNASNC